MPNSRRTPTRSTRVPDELWHAFQQICAEHGETATEVVVRSIDQYVRSRGYGVDPVTILERLHRLHAAGGITDGEWARKRRDLLDRI